MLKQHFIKFHVYFYYYLVKMNSDFKNDFFSLTNALFTSVLFIFQIFGFFPCYFIVIDF